ncbi:hypothetical protein F3Y22_tig00111138pilonHSYRG00001 [Hibiscus syriacus]|uniref:R13L1/DRL21-like LRR repeat region domain-containing protein n=1 Tax=Hibiscus syriacus TaxID=106335 RepID=A0A6A2YXP5_HIBSY|nr:hypothetical protein F3Y22_tig00111138pilonHSYRG00001 [Hibiscus syriacus]
MAAAARRSSIGKLEYCMATVEVRTLEEFVVDLVVNHRSKLGDLGSFAHLRGNLKIIGLGDVRRRTDAEEAGLWKKTDLRNLTLSFISMRKDKRFLGHAYIPVSPALQSSGPESPVLEALQLPPHLEYLNINRMSNSIPQLDVVVDDVEEVAAPPTSSEDNSASIRYLRLPDPEGALFGNGTGETGPTSLISPPSQLMVKAYKEIGIDQTLLGFKESI